MNANSIISIIIGIAIFVLGGGTGVLYQMQKTFPQLVQLEETTAILKILNSKELSRITVFGKVTKIKDRDITLLSEKGGNIRISMEDSASYYSFIKGLGAEAENIVRKQIKFEDIKVGDNLNAIVKLLENGRLNGQSVIILPYYSDIKL